MNQKYAVVKMTARLLLLFFSFIASPVFAEVIEFPEEEIATETVLPVFDRREVVKNRHINLKKRFELGAGMGLALNEAFYNPLNFNAGITYHFTESHGVDLSAFAMVPGLSNYGQALRSGEGLTPGQSFDPSLAPSPRFMLLGNYQFTAYYGKISITKQSVMNLSLFADAGLGYIGFNGTNAIALNLGIGQNFYFTEHLALRLDLRLLVYRAPDPTSLNLTTGSPAPAASAFDQTTYLSTMLTAGIVYVL